MNGTLSASHSVQPPMRSQGLPADPAPAGPAAVPAAGTGKWFSPKWWQTGAM